MKNAYAKIAVLSNYATLKIVPPTDLPWPRKKSRLTPVVPKFLMQ